MNLETLEAFGMSAGVIIYLLVERAAMVKMLASPRAKFLAPGALALVIVVLFYLAQDPRPPLYVPVIKWLGLWVFAMMAKATVKDNEAKKEPTDKAS